MLLAAIGDVGFVLAGAGAIRAHGLTERPTYDVDLFASRCRERVKPDVARHVGRRA